MTDFLTVRNKINSQHSKWSNFSAVVSQYFILRPFLFFFLNLHELSNNYALIPNYSIHFCQLFTKQTNLKFA